MLISILQHLRDLNRINFIIIINIIIIIIIIMIAISIIIVIIIYCTLYIFTCTSRNYTEGV